MRRLSLIVVPASFVCGIAAVVSDRWAVAVLAYVVVLMGTLNMVSTLDPGHDLPSAMEPPARAVPVLAEPRPRVVRLTSGGLGLKAGVVAAVLTVTTVAGAATGRLPGAFQHWVAGAVERWTWLDLPGGERTEQGRPSGEERSDDGRAGPPAPSEPGGPVPTSPGGPGDQPPEGGPGQASQPASPQAPPARPPTIPTDLPGLNVPHTPPAGPGSAPVDVPSTPPVPPVGPGTVPTEVPRVKPDKAPPAPPDAIRRDPQPVAGPSFEGELALLRGTPLGSDEGPGGPLGGR